MTGSLTSIIASVLGIPARDLPSSASMDTLQAWDSLRQFLLMLEIERRYGVRMSNDEMFACTSLVQIRELLAARGVSADD